MGGDSTKKTKDKIKVKNLRKLAIGCLLTRLLLFLLPRNITGLIIEVLWVPPFFYLLALIFNGFEYLIDLIAARRKN